MRYKSEKTHVNNFQNTTSYVKFPEKFESFIRIRLIELQPCLKIAEDRKRLQFFSRIFPICLFACIHVYVYLNKRRKFICISNHTKQCFLKKIIEAAFILGENPL